VHEQQWQGSTGFDERRLLNKGADRVGDYPMQIYLSEKSIAGDEMLEFITGGGFSMHAVQHEPYGEAQQAANAAKSDPAKCSPHTRSGSIVPQEFAAPQEDTNSDRNCVSSAGSPGLSRQSPLPLASAYIHP
jgi:hypothetical protein